jgi:hypothetical protein
MRREIRHQIIGHTYTAMHHTMYRGEIIMPCLPRRHTTQNKEGGGGGIFSSHPFVL